MYQNKVTLIGFLGSDAEVHTNNNRSFTTLSLATKSSSQEGRQVRLANRMASLHRLRQALGVRRHPQEGCTYPGGKGVAQPGVDSKKTDLKQRIWEIKVDSILKLDRAEEAVPEEQEHYDVSTEEVAA